MSELRAWCEEFANYANHYVSADYIDDKKISIDALEAFAKEQQIKGMEAVHRDLVSAALAHANTSGQAALGAVANKLLNEIAKLKEGG